MLLRTRITLIVAAGFTLLMLGIWGATLLRDRVAETREGQLAIDGQTVLWREIVAFQTTNLGRMLDRADNSPTFRITLGYSDRQGVAAALQDAGIDVDDEDTYFEVVGADREIIYSEVGGATRSILDASSLDRALKGETLGGLRQVSASKIIVVATRTITLSDKGTAVLVLGRDASLGMDRFARGISAETTLVTLRGQLAGSTDPRLWARAQPSLNLTPRRPLAEHIVLGGKSYTVTSIPVPGLSGSTVGALVSFIDTTEVQAATSLIRSAAVWGAIVLVVLGVIGLNLFLWYSFRPLEAAIDVLQALARGDTSVTVEHAGHDEIGRIASAVVGLRGNVQALAEARRQRERVRRRQEAVISTELKALADAIDPTDREEVLALLARGTGDGHHEDELKRVARVLHDLSRRIVEQHTRLSSMVVELREALVTKTKLAGLQQELEIARQVQLAILPKEFPPDPRVAVHGQMTAAREVGGDFYDYFMIDDTTLGFVVADVSGKGVPAALFMAISRTLLRSTALFERSPSASVRRLNDLLAEENEQMLFVTLFYGVLDLNSGRVTYVNAGHNLPYHITRAGEVTTVPSTKGMAVAVLEGFVYIQQELQLKPGDTLFLYTDGVTEAFDIDERPYGEERLEELLESGACDWSVPDLSERVLASVHVFERGAPQADDITCLTLRYSGGQGPRRS